jgi:hypothetical protein
MCCQVNLPVIHAAMRWTFSSSVLKASETELLIPQYMYIEMPGDSPMYSTENSKIKLSEQAPL